MKKGIAHTTEEAIQPVATEAYLPGLSVDNVIFGFHADQLKVLLLECRNRKDWMLPGGYIRKDESVDDAAKRVLQDRSGLKNVYLQQFSVFGETRRTKESVMRSAMKSLDISFKDGDWFNQRYVTIGYYALVEFEKVKPTPDTFSVSCAWFDLNALPTMIFDHKEIVEQALVALRQHLHYKPIGYSLLPSTFTMKSLQAIYETILQRKLDRSNFNRKMLSLGILEKKEKLFTGAAHKAPYQYSFNKKEYFRLLKEGFGMPF